MAAITFLSTCHMSIKHYTAVATRSTSLTFIPAKKQNKKKKNFVERSVNVAIWGAQLHVTRRETDDGDDDEG